MKLSRQSFVLFLLLIVINVYSQAGLAFSTQEHFYKRMNTIEKLMGDKQYDEALRRLDKLYASYKNRKHEKSLLFQLYGYVHSYKGNTDKAIQYFEDCLSLKTLPTSALQNLRLNISQLRLDKKQYQMAGQMFEQWQNAGKPLQPQGFALGGIIYAYQKKYSKAEELLVRAIQTAKKPKEQWFQLLLSIYIDSKKYKKARGLLLKVVAQYPEKKQYWIRLADVNYLLNDYLHAASIMELANKKGFLTQAAEFKKLAGFYYYAGIPYKSAQTLEYAFDKNYIKPTIPILKQQAYYYRQAKAYSHAARSIKRALSISQEPKLLYELALIYADANNWGKVSKTLEKIKKNTDHDLEKNVSLLLGQSYFEQGKLTEANNIFNQLIESDREQQAAKNWKLYTQKVMELQK